MKKTILALAASQLLIAGSAFANSMSKDAVFTIKAPLVLSSCGVIASNTSAEIGEWYSYTVKAEDTKISPFVNITNWEVGENKVTPKYVYLEGIGYKFGDIGKAIGWVPGTTERPQQFRLVKRPDVDYPSGLEDTKLTMTVTCFETQKEFDDNFKWSSYFDMDTQLEDHNIGTILVDGKIMTPSGHVIDDDDDLSVVEGIHTLIEDPVPPMPPIPPMPSAPEQENSED